MSELPARARSGKVSIVERYESWIATAVSVLLHVLMVAILLYTAKVVMTTPQGAASGSRVKVDFIGNDRDATPPPPSPPPTRPPTPPPTTQRLNAEAVQPPVRPQVQQPPSPPNPYPPARRRPETWTGRPPGLAAEDTAPENAGYERGPAREKGNQHDMTASTPSMDVGGYQVYYNLRAEEQLRSWKAQGMTELFLPLPGTQQYMVCPLQTALDRSSGKCRLLDPNAPEMKRIGDARQVITVMDVYRRGERVWQGPGAYR